MYAESVQNLEAKDFIVTGGYQNMNNLQKTQEELMLLYIKSVNELLDNVKAKEKELKKSKDNDPKTVMHYTRRIVQDWFRAKGGLPIPD